MLDPRDSTTYQAILRKGREQGWAQAREDARFTGGKRFLICVGPKKFGEADAATLAMIEAIHDFEKLEALADRMVESDVRDWSQLLRTS
jgi:hypothetical protein